MEKVGKCPSRQLTDSSSPRHIPPAKLGSHQNSPATTPTRAVGPIPPIPCRQACRTRFAREARANLKRRSTPPPTHCSHTDSDRLRAQLHSRQAARPALPPAGIAAGAEPAAACALARVPRMECERTSGQRSRQPRQHSRRLRPRGANCGHCPVRRSVACGHTGLQRCRGSASNLGGCAVQRPPGAKVRLKPTPVSVVGDGRSHLCRQV